MTSEQSAPRSDVWSQWLLQARFGDDPAYARRLRGRLEDEADRVLDGARLAAGMTLADIGTGEGLLAFRAIDRIGPALSVIFADLSAPVLRHVEALAVERGVRDRCAFHQCTAEDLGSIASGSVDVVTTRAVLAYVGDKRAALAEFHRILKPGGRISLAEPVFQDEALAVSALKTMVDEGQPGRVLPLLHRWMAAQFPDTPEKIAASPLTNYTERDLFQLALAAGFAEIHLEFHIDVRPLAVTSWEAMLGKSPHPWAPPLGVILDEQFTPEERLILETAVREAVSAPSPVAIERMAYLTATKP